MVAKAARVKKIPFTCEITDPPGKKHFSTKHISNPVSGLARKEEEGIMTNHAPYCYLKIRFRNYTARTGHSSKRCQKIVPNPSPNL